MSSVVQFVGPAPTALLALTQHLYSVNGCKPVTTTERVVLLDICSVRCGVRWDVHDTVNPVIGEKRKWSLEDTGGDQDKFKVVLEIPSTDTSSGA